MMSFAKVGCACKVPRLVGEELFNNGKTKGITSIILERKKYLRKKLVSEQYFTPF